MKKQIRKAVIPAAGFGTRFLPFTKAVPKELVPLVDKPVIQYVVEEAVAAGIDQILIVTSSGKNAIQDHFNRTGDLERRLEETGKTALLEELRAISSLADIHYIYQQELNGLGDAVLCAKSFVGDDPFAVLLGDTVLDSSTDVTVTGQLAAARSGDGSKSPLRKRLRAIWRSPRATSLRRISSLRSPGRPAGKAMRFS